MFILCLGRCGALFWTLQCSPDVANCVCGVQKDVGLGGGSLSVHLMLLTVWCSGRCGAGSWTPQCSPDVANCVCGVQEDTGLGGGPLSVHLYQHAGQSHGTRDDRQRQGAAGVHVCHRAQVGQSEVYFCSLFSHPI